MSATGVGSMPGTDSEEAARIIVGELPDFVHVPELPLRGPGADLIGRTAGLLTHVSSEFGLDTVPTGWRQSGSIGAVMRRATSWLAEDLDHLEGHAMGYRGPLKVSVAGPWTLAANIEGRNGERLVSDLGACRDIAQGLAAALDHLVTDIRRRFPKVDEIFVQLDEPSLPAVLAGTLASASGLSRYPPIEEAMATQLLTVAIDGLVVAGFHCCAADAPIGIFQASGARFLSVDLTMLSHVRDVEIGQAIEDGVVLFAGVVPSLDPSRPLRDADVARPITSLAHRLGLEERIHSTCVVTPTCGLAGASTDWVKNAYRLCQQVARGMRDEEDVDANEG